MLATPTLLCASALALATPAVSGGQVAEARRHVELKSGIRMAYQVAGPEGGPPLLMLHGLGDTSRSWSLMRAALEKSNRLYMLDQRGHGGTEAPECCYALADLAFDVVAFMDAMKIDNAAIAGHSLGSFVGQYLATAYPSRVRRLVLLGSADTAAGSDVAGWLWAQLGTFDTRVTAAFVEEWQSNPTPVPAEFLAHVKRETGEVPLHVWRGVARSLLTEDQRGFLDAIRAPVLILAGEQDPMFPKPFQERLLQALPQAGLKSFPEVGHNLHWEIPERVAAEIEAFLRTSAAPR